ncbi:hypothetical protein LJC05_00775 [Bacteroides sp. OttesenSCG-928-J23]|nr:hypothetical protein [Bacteroides sp. OttesenSCG-928-J23]
MNLRTYKPLLALAALAFGLAACDSQELGTGTSPDGNELTITADTRGVVDGTYELKIKIDGDATTHVADLTVDGTDVTIEFWNKIFIAPGTKTLNIIAWTDVNYKYDKTDEESLMPVIHQNAATPVVWSPTTGPSIELRLVAASSLIHLKVTDSDGGTISTEDATMPNASSCMWSTEATDIGVLISSGSFTFTANGLEQILPTTIAAGKKLFVIPVDGVDKTLYALKDYTFAAGTEYTFNVRITTSGEAILEGFTIKGMDAGAQLGNYMIIRNIADLRTFRNRVNDGEYSLCAIQTADIVMEAVDKAGEGWEPIGNFNGTTGTKFTGIYNGGGHTISGLTIDRPKTSYDYNSHQGLFGNANGATFTNIHLEDVNITGYGRDAALVGYAISANISHCSTTSGKITGYEAGGLIGHLDDNSSVTYCYATIPVIGVRAGGLIGHSNGVSTTSRNNIAACYATGTVTNITDGVGNDFIELGGLLGRGWYSNIYFCYAEGAITNPYANGGSSYPSYTSGLVGNVRDAIITSCYATGTVTASDGILGSLVGYSFTAIANFTYCHAVPKGDATQLVSNSAILPTGCSITAGEAKLTVKTNYISNTGANNAPITVNGEDFDANIWDDNNPPKLQWQIPTP